MPDAELEAYCRHALERHPQDARLRRRLADSMLASNSDGAASEYRTAVSLLESGDVWTLIGAANGMLDLGLGAEAFEWAADAGDMIDSSHRAYPDVLNLQGRINFLAGDLTAAVVRLRAALELDLETRHHWSDLAEVLVRTGRADKARELLEFGVQDEWLTAAYVADEYARWQDRGFTEDEGRVGGSA